MLIQTLTYTQTCNTHPHTHTHTQALEEKERGNAAYKQKNFASALQHYSRAVELDPTNITFLTNKAGQLQAHRHAASYRTVSRRAVVQSGEVALVCSSLWDPFVASDTTVTQAQQCGAAHHTALCKGHHLHVCFAASREHVIALT